jgi:hypothetical protein
VQYELSRIISPQQTIGILLFPGARVSSSSHRICPSKEKREKRDTRHNVFWGENRIDIITAPCSLSRLLCCSVGVNDGNDL